MDVTVWPLGTALLVGLLFGYVAQRGRFCLLRALSNLLLTGDTAVLRAYVLALAVAVLGTSLLVPLGLVEDLPVSPFHWAGNLVGGLIFGAGMVLSGGCAGSTWYRVGEGALGAGVILVGFAVGASATSVGALRPLREALQRSEITAAGSAATLPALLGVPTWVVVAVLVGGLLAWLGLSSGEATPGPWHWSATGLAVGVIIVLGWYLSAASGAPTGVTFAANTGHVLTYVMLGYPNRVTWGMVLVVSVATGSALAAWRAGEFAWKPVPGFTAARLFAGGLTMGVGALLAHGCNITQGLTNAATLAAGSFAAFAAMLAGSVATLWLTALRRSSPVNRT